MSEDDRARRRRADRTSEGSDGQDDENEPAGTRSSRGRRRRSRERAEPTPNQGGETSEDRGGFFDDGAAGGSGSWVGDVERPGRRQTRVDDRGRKEPRDAGSDAGLDAASDSAEPTIELERDVATEPPGEPTGRDEFQAEETDLEAATEAEPVRDRLLLRGVDLAAAGVTKWRSIRETSLRAAVDRFASRHVGPSIRAREERFEDYRRRHVQARIDRDWDVQLAVGALLTVVGAAIGFAVTLLATTGLLGLSVLDGLLASGVAAAWLGVAGSYWFTAGKVRTGTYQRRREIEKLLPQAVAYMFSHSQGQQTVPEIIENLAHEQETYGAISEEFGVVHKEVAIFESDLRHALRQARETTPSANLSAFFDELINVIDTSGELTEFLREKTEEYQSRSLIEEERFIGRLSLVAFAYTFAGVFVPVMAIITLVFLSMMGWDVLGLGLLLAWGYVTVLSVGTWLVVRVLAVDDMNTTPTLSTSYAGASIEDISTRLASDDGGSSDPPDARKGARADGGSNRHVANPRRIESRVDGHGAPLSERERESLSALARALKVVGARRALNNVWETLDRQPLYTMLGSIPVATLFVAVAILAGIANPPVPGWVARPVWDTTVAIVVPLVVVLAPLWVFSRRHRTHDAAVREDLPNMLRKLSSATEAGTPFVESIKTVGETAEDDLSAELRLMRNELSTFFADLEDALVRMANRVRNPRLTRVATLLVEANTSSGNVQDILAVAAKDAENSKRLDEKRFSKMERQMFVIVTGFFAFLVIAASFQFFLLPHMLEALEFAGDVDTERVAFFPSVDPRLFTLVMFHSAVSIGLFSGLVAGKFGYDDARAGAGWALVQVLGASAVFWTAAVLVG